MTTTAPEPDATLLDQVRSRHEGTVPEGSRFLAQHDDLAEQARRWEVELAPVRAATAAQVAELLGPAHPLARARRFVVVMAVLVFFMGRYCVVDWPRSWFGRRPASRFAARRLRQAFEHLGPSYVKFGQFIASSRGLVPDVLVDEFASTRDACPGLRADVVRRVVEAELGPIEAHFADFDPRPLAAASIAQVHRATLLDGTPVVVKVQRPGIARQIEAHIRSMPALARLVERAFPKLPIADPHALVALFAHLIVQELDFRLEAQNMVDIGLDLEAAGVADVVVPHPIPGLVTPRVLVMERFDGLAFDDLAEMRAAGIDPTDLLVSGVRALVEGATVFGRFHGDVHAGNVLVLRDGRFGLVDFGICARLDATERAGLQRLLVGIALRDVRIQVHGLDALGALPVGTDRRTLVAKLTAAQRHQADALSVDDLRDGASHLMNVFVEHRLQLPAALVLFFKDVLYLNGSTRLLAPDLDLAATFAGLHGHFDAKYGAGRVVLTDDPYGPPITDDEVDAVDPVLLAEPAPPPEPPSLGSLAREFGPRALTDGVAPVVVFSTVNSWGGLTWAIVALTVWAVGLALVRRRGSGGVGLVLPITLVFLALRAVAGIATGSDTVYFAPAILNSLLIAAAFGFSVLIGHPLAGVIARAFYPFPARARRHPTFKRVFRRISLAWAVLLTGNSVVQMALLALVSTEAYLASRLPTGLLSTALFVFSLSYPRRVFERDPELVVILGFEVDEDGKPVVPAVEGG